MKLSEIVKITKPNYKYFKITPNNSVRNHSTHRLAKSIGSIYKTVFQQVKVNERKLIKMFGRDFNLPASFNLNTSEKVSYFIYIEKQKVEFYFIIPEQYETLIVEKLNDVWSSTTIVEVDELPTFKDNVTKYALQYAKEDPLSLAVDRRSNELLRSNLNIINVLNEGEKVGIFYNFVPITQRSWKHTYKYTIDKLKNKEPVDRNKSNASYILKAGLTMFTNLLNEILNIFNDKKEERLNPIDYFLSKLNGNLNIKDATIMKENAIILDTQIVVLSESDDKTNQVNNAKAVAQSFDAIAEDNKLISKPFRGKINYNAYKLNAPSNKVSDLECSNFISLAGRDILEEYNFIDKVETKETQVPEELREGTWNIGFNTYRGNEQDAFLSEHKEYKYLSLFPIGPSRAGKTTLFGNLSKNAIDNDESVILFDFIENCEMSTQVANLFPEDKVLNIVCDNLEDAQGMGYNEIRKSDDPEQQYINAKSQTTQLSTLINSVNTDDAPLTARMKRYLTSASLVVFLSGGSIKDVFSVLQNHIERHKYINKVPSEQIENMNEYLGYLYELDEYDKNGESVVGTNLNRVEGIISRLNILKDNPFMELMLKKTTEGNIDLVDEMEKNKLICIKMPESMFNTDEERDIYCIYWITKIWLALQVRAKLIPDKDKRKKVNLFIDEMYQVQNTEAFIATKLSRFAKFRLKPIISCHYLGQIKHIKRELAGANASYMLISGCDKDNFDEFKDELKPYTVEDLLNLKEYHSLNLIKTKGGYAKFITHLPPPVGEEKNKEIERNSVQSREILV